MAVYLRGSQGTPQLHSVGKSMTDVRVSNRAAVLRHLYSHGGLSRKELARRLNLTPATLTNITAGLIGEKVLIEGSPREGGARSGRKEVVLEIDLKHFRALGVYAAERSMTAFCMDLAGETLFERRHHFDELATGPEMLGAICDSLEQYLAGLPEGERRRVIGLGLALRGLVDPVHGVSIRSFGLWEDNLDVRAIMEARFPGLGIHMNNNVRCIANAQNLLHNGSRSMLFLKYGPLLGGAFILDGALYCGHNYQAFELAHTIVDLSGPVCRCGKRGCLESIINFHLMAKHLEIQYSQARVPILFEITRGDRRNIAMDTILAAYDREDRVVRETVNRAIEYLAMEIVNTMVLINTESIVLYGPPFESQAFMARLLDEVERLGVGTQDTVIMKSQSNLELDHFGCVSIVLKDFLDSGATVAGKL